MNQTKPESAQLRILHFQDLESAVDEAKSLLASSYTQQGRWSLGQICRHLRLVQDPSIDGYPKWLSLFAPFRPLVRWVLLSRILRGDSPKGIPTAFIFVPPDDVNDESEVAAFAESVDRFLAHSGKFHPHPGFGRLDRVQLERLHAAHAAHHLRFLRPNA